MDPQHDVDGREEERQPPRPVVVPVPVLAVLGVRVRPQEERQDLQRYSDIISYHVAALPFSGERRSCSRSDFSVFQELDEPTDLQDAEEEDEDAEASVRGDVGLDLAIQRHAGHDAGEADDEPNELDADVEVEPERVHPPEVAGEDGADGHQDAPREHVERAVSTTQAVGEGPVHGSLACRGTANQRFVDREEDLSSFSFFRLVRSADVDLAAEKVAADG